MPGNMTYEDVLALLEEKIPNGTKEEKLELIADLAALRVGNPSYQRLLVLIAKDPDQDIKDGLTAQTFIFEELLEEEEKNIFSYADLDYIADNPGYDISNNFISYVGIYFSPSGETT